MSQFNELEGEMRRAIDAQQQADKCRAVVSERLKRMHKKQKMSISTLGGTLGIGYRLLFYWLSGKGQPSIDAMRRMVTNLKKAA